MALEQRPLRPGEREFLERFKQQPQFERVRTQEFSSRQEAAAATKKSVSEFLDELRQEISQLPEVKREAELHHENLPDLVAILAQAVETTLEKGLKDGLALVLSTRDPFIIDAYHDLMAGHFFQALLRHNKVKIMP